MRTCRQWPWLAAPCCDALRLQIQGGALASGCCCQFHLGRAAASGSSPCHLGSSWHLELVPTWQPDSRAHTHTRTAGWGHCQPVCYLAFLFFYFRTNKHAGRNRTVTHGSLVTRVRESTSWFPPHCSGRGSWGFAGVRLDARFRFSHMSSSPFFSVLLGFVCAVSPFPFDPHLFFFPLDVCAWVRLKARSHDCFGFKHWRSQRKLAEKHVAPYGRPIDETVFILEWRMPWQGIVNRQIKLYNSVNLNDCVTKRHPSFFSLIFFFVLWRFKCVPGTNLRTCCRLDDRCWQSAQVQGAGCRVHSHGAGPPEIPGHSGQCLLM